METNQKKIRPSVVICGRTNVGKSTLFNRLTEKGQAMISNIAGTTRDSNIGLVAWNRAEFNLIDTAGLTDSEFLNSKKADRDKNVDIQAQIQAKKYLKNADLIILLVDAKAGLLAEDRELSKELKKNEHYRPKTIVVANKIDNFKNAGETAQFNKLGLGEPLIISALTGLGTGDLLDVLADKLTNKKTPPLNKVSEDNYKPAVTEPENNINLCIIGQPNAGKSSLLNAILGYRRVIVSPIPHTTREPQNTEIVYKENSLTLVDTAGINRKKIKVKNLEKLGIFKSLKSLDKADIALLTLDLSRPLTHQDAKLVQEIVERRKSLIIIGNKWDLVNPRDPKKWTEIIYDKLPFATWAPICFVSAKTGRKVNTILNLVLTVAKQRALTLSTSQCEKFMKAVIKIHKPGKAKGTKPPHLYEFKQIKNNPPLFSLRIGPNDSLHFSYLRFMENRLRERHGFLGTPIHIKIKKGTKKTLKEANNK